MRKITKLQINVPVDIKEKFQQIAEEYGLDLSNAIRFLMVNVNKGVLSLNSRSNKLTVNGFTPEVEKEILETANGDLARDKNGKVLEFDSVKGMMEYLNSDEE